MKKSEREIEKMEFSFLLKDEPTMITALVVRLQRGKALIWHPQLGEILIEQEAGMEIYFTIEGVLRLVSLVPLKFKFELTKI